MFQLPIASEQSSINGKMRQQRKKLWECERTLLLFALWSIIRAVASGPAAVADDDSVPCKKRWRNMRCGRLVSRPQQISEYRKAFFIDAHIHHRISFNRTQLKDVETKVDAIFNLVLHWIFFFGFLFLSIKWICYFFSFAQSSRWVILHEVATGRGSSSDKTHIFECDADAVNGGSLIERGEYVINITNSLLFVRAQSSCLTANFLLFFSVFSDDSSSCLHHIFKFFQMYTYTDGKSKHI